MPKVQIELNQDTYDKLKIEAKSHYQSLRGYIANHMTQFMNNPDMFITTPNLPEGTSATIKVKAQKPLTPEEIEEQKKQKFLNKCKTILGEKTYKNWEPDMLREFIILTPDSNYYNDAERIPDKGIRMAYSMSEDKQDKYIADIKAYIDHEERR